MGNLKTARFGSLALPLPNVDRFLLLGGKSNSTIGRDSAPNIGTKIGRASKVDGSEIERF